MTFSLINKEFYDFYIKIFNNFIKNKFFLILIYKEHNYYKHKFSFSLIYHCYFFYILDLNNKFMKFYFFD